MPDTNDFLIVVDVQNDFLPGGALAVPEGNDILPVINRVSRDFVNVVLTQDWHPAGHSSFASAHPGKHPYDAIEFLYGRQILWPDHCVQGTSGADFAPGLSVPHAQLVIRKGCQHGIDSYSAFRAADRTTRTGLEGYLRERDAGHLYICGLATDFCVAWTALDARSAGFDVSVLMGASRGIRVDGSLDRALGQLVAAGIALVDEL